MIFDSLRTLVIASLAFILVAFVPIAAVHAASNQAAGIGIKPALIEDGVNPGDQKDYIIQVTNLSQSKQTYYLSTKDIASVDSGGVPVYADPNAPKTGYELSSWVTLNKNQITLEPNQEVPVNVSINIPNNATPGSHFGAVFISMIPPKLRSNGAAVGYEVANIISLRVAGDAVDKAQIQQFTTGNYIYGKTNVDFDARVANQGNVLVRPVGPLEVFNMFGKRVSLLTMNQSKAGIFPGKNRDFKLTWEDPSPGFGRYQAIVSLVYGDQGKKSTISSTVTFWILPMNIILPAVGVLLVLLLATYIFVRFYIRRRLHGYAGGARRVVNNRRRGGGMSAFLLVVVVMLAVTALFLLILLALFA